MDHDQRFKLLLQAFLQEFLELFFPGIARRLDFTQPVVWLDKETFLDPPQGAKRVLDIVAQLHTLEPVRGQPATAGSETLALIHIEIEGEDRVAPLRADMYHYYEVLRRRGLPVLPLALYLQVGLEGLGTDVYEEFFWEYRTVRFEYQYVGLPALDAGLYATGPNLLGVALAALMRMGDEVKAALTARMIQRVSTGTDDAYRKVLLADCILSYATLDEAQKQELDDLLNTESFKEGLAMRNSLYEHARREAIQVGRQEGRQEGWQEGRQEGWQEGRQEGQRQLLRELLEGRFGALSATALSRLESWPAEQLAELGQGLLAGKSLQELGLED